VIITPLYNPNEPPYQAPFDVASPEWYFLPGAGEALPLQAVSLRFEGVIKIEGNLVRHIIIPSLQYASSYCPIAFLLGRTIFSSRLALLQLSNASRGHQRTKMIWISSVPTVKEGAAGQGTILG
jgi:hypothetical protein